MASAHLTRRKTKEDLVLRRENIDPVVSRVTTFKLGGIWRPKEQEPSKDKAFREKERRTKMEEKWWNSSDFKILIHYPCN